MRLAVKRSTFNYERRDGGYALFLDDVMGAQVSGVKTVRAKGLDAAMKLKNSTDVAVENAIYYDDQWGNSPTGLPRIDHPTGNGVVLPRTPR